MNKTHFHNVLFQNEESSSDSKSDKPKSDDPVVDLFPDDDTEERGSKLCKYVVNKSDMNA